MFKKFKSFLQEIKDEVAQEEKASLEKVAQTKDRAAEAVESASYDEKFVTALAAPFRNIVFAYWFSLFKEDPNAPAIFPQHLYVYGPDVGISDSNIKELQKLLKRDFRIIDQTTTYNMVLPILENLEIKPNPDKTPQKLSLEASIASCTICAHILTAATDVGYIAKTEAAPLLQDIATYVRQKVASWEEYGQAFLAGEKELMLNHGIGHKILEKYIEQFNTKPNSPWLDVRWEG